MSGVAPAFAEGVLNGAVPFPAVREAFLRFGLNDDRDTLSTNPDEIPPVLRNVEYDGDERYFVALREGVAHARRGDFRQAYHLFVEVTKLRPSLVDGWCYYGWTLSKLGDRELAITIYDYALNLFDPIVGEFPRVDRCFSLRCFTPRATLLGAPRRRQEETAAYRELLARFGTTPGSPLADPVTEALRPISAALAFSRAYEIDDALAIFDDLSRLGSAIEPSLRKDIPHAIATALYNKGVSLGLSADALPFYDDLLARCGDATDLPILVLVSMGLFNKGGVVLDRGLGR